MLKIIPDFVFREGGGKLAVNDFEFAVLNQLL
jgi:hypothetical protein